MTFLQVTISVKMTYHIQMTDETDGKSWVEISVFRSIVNLLVNHGHAYRYRKAMFQHTKAYDYKKDFTFL